MRPHALRPAVVATFLFAALQVAAVPVRIAFVAPASLDAPLEPVVGQLRIRATATHDLRVVNVQVPGMTEVELGDGSYIVELDASGWWAASRLITTSDAGTIELPVRRAGTIGGALAGVDDVGNLNATFDDGAVTGQAQCTVASRAFRCEVPAGTLNLRLGSQGHVPYYLWKVAIAAGETRMLGMIPFARGASVAGYVNAEGEPLHDVRLALTSLRAGAIQSIAIKVAASGFFSAGPVDPGDYTVTAAQRGLVSISRSVAVEGGMEAVLREPLVLSKPRTLRVTISPSTDPLGEGWSASLVRRARGGAGEVVARGTVSADGSWVADTLAAGDYRLLIRPVRGPVWHYEDVALADPVTTLPVAIDGVRFIATVRLGGKPLAAATLLFNGEHSANPIPFQTDENGQARGYLPAPGDGRWFVTVRSDDPQVRSTIDAVVKTDTPSGIAAIDIALSDGTIAGTVVDENGSPAEYALVSLNGAGADDPLTQVKADEAGAFVLRGLQHGRYRLSATAFLKESDMVGIDLKDEQVEVELHLNPYRQWRGTVRTPDGQPVRGATVFAVAVDVPIQLAYPARTDHEGRFAALTPAGAKEFDVHVEPRGYSYSFSRRPVSEELNLVVDRRGGTLVVEFDHKDGKEPFLWHGGSAMTATSFLSAWQAEFETTMPEKTRVRIPQLEPGEYTICLMPPAEDLRTVKPRGACKTLYLAPFATEVVVLRATDPSS